MCDTRNALGLRNACRGNDLNLATARSNFVQNSFTYRAGLEWNEIPRTIRASNGAKFNSDLKLYYMD